MSALRMLVALLSVGAVLTGTPQKVQNKEETEIKNWLAKQSSCEVSQIHIDRVDHFDLTGDGQKETIVVASTCNTGTAGPDVHSVLGHDSKGQFIELKIADVDPTNYEVLFGNRNYDLTAEDGLLVERFTDTSDREAPLVIRYKWEGKQFAIASIEKSKPFPTSYDCTKASKEVEHAICYVEPLAALDVQLSGLYRSLLTGVSGTERDTLRAEQRKWLAARESQCTIYKGWVDCLQDMYEKRIADLQKASCASPK
jgi:uncharacterized protein YecT (DUF1311 family)